MHGFEKAKKEQQLQEQKRQEEEQKKKAPLFKQSTPNMSEGPMLLSEKADKSARENYEKSVLTELAELKRLLAKKKAKKKGPVQKQKDGKIQAEGEEPPSDNCADDPDNEDESASDDSDETDSEDNDEDRDNEKSSD